MALYSRFWGSENWIEIGAVFLACFFIFGIFFIDCDRSQCFQGFG